MSISLFRRVLRLSLEEFKRQHLDNGFVARDFEGGELIRAYEKMEQTLTAAAERVDNDKRNL
jgi:hypothetical protein